jgi:hypothetical protein
MASPTPDAAPDAAPPVRVVAACIFKNEAHNLPALFDSAKGLIDAWVVVDTGSTDDTLDVALEQARLHDVPAYVHTDPWDDDFARSRNVSLDLVDQQFPEAAWVMVLDGDDRFDAPLEARAQLDALMAGSYPEGLTVSPAFLGIRVDSPTHTGLMETLVQVRTFHREAGIRYQYPVHGKPDLSRWASEDPDVVTYAFKLEDCRVLHLGYDDPDHYEENLDRTLRILREKMDPNSLHRMAYEARALAALGCWAEVGEITERALDLGETHTTAVILSLHAQAVEQDGDYVDALGTLAEALEIEEGSVDVWGSAMAVAVRGFAEAAFDAVRGKGIGRGISASLPNAPTLLRHAVQAGLLGVEEKALRVFAREVYTRTRLPSPAPRPIEPGDPFLRHVPPELHAKKTGMRVLVVGSHEIGGQGGLTLDAINRYTVHAARMVTYEDDYLDYPHKDVILLDNGPDAIHEAAALADAADFFHCVRRPVLNDFLGWGRRLRHDNAIVAYMGSKLRADPAKLLGWHERTGVFGLSAWDWTMLEHAFMPYHVPGMIDVDVMGEAEVYRGLGHSNFRVCHPTTRRSFKKTDLFLAAVEAANARLTAPTPGAGVIEPVLIEGMSNADCITVKRTCHATFDQLSVGIHGLSAMESMAMGHAVLGGISAWARSFAPDVPIVRVTEETLADQLVALAKYPEAVYGYAIRSREYVRRLHHPRTVIGRYADLYEHIRHGNRLLRGDEDYLL